MMGSPYNGPSARHSPDTDGHKDSEETEVFTKHELILKLLLILDNLPLI